MPGRPRKNQAKVNADANVTVETDNGTASLVKSVTNPKDHVAVSAAASVVDVVAATPVGDQVEGASEARPRRSARQLGSDEVLTLIENQISQNDTEKACLKERTNALKEIRKFVMKTQQHQQKTKTRQKETRKPTGFARPRGISDEMVDYLVNTAGINEVNVTRRDDASTSVQIGAGCKLARNELTKALCEHFKKSNMRKDPKDQRRIFLDQQTQQLFNITDLQAFETNGGTVSDDGEPVITYFDLQKYLPRHCLKEVAA